MTNTSKQQKITKKHENSLFIIRVTQGNIYIQSRYLQTPYDANELFPANEVQYITNYLIYLWVMISFLSTCQFTL